MGDQVGVFSICAPWTILKGMVAVARFSHRQNLCMQKEKERVRVKASDG